MPQRTQQKIMELVAALSEDQQSAVVAFIHYLNDKASAGTKTDAHAALDEFVHEHSELLRRLAE